ARRDRLRPAPQGNRPRARAVRDRLRLDGPRRPRSARLLRPLPRPFSADPREGLSADAGAWRRPSRRRARARHDRLRTDFRRRREGWFAALLRRAGRPLHPHEPARRRAASLRLPPQAPLTARAPERDAGGSAETMTPHRDSSAQHSQNTQHFRLQSTYELILNNKDEYWPATADGRRSGGEPRGGS